MGGSHGRPALTDEQVADVRQRYSTGVSQRALSREYGLAQQTISKIVHGIRYSHLPLSKLPSLYGRPRFPAGYVIDPTPFTKDELSRFWEKVSVNEHGCWAWTALLTTSGYGQLKFRGKMRVAHVVSWTLHYGPIPHGLKVLHECDNGFCVRPEHLRLGTNADNTHDMVAKGRHGTGENKSRREREASRWIRPRGPTRSEVLLAKEKLWLLDLKRTAFGRLNVLDLAGQDRNRKTLLICECFCGNVSVVRFSDLQRLSVQSCGCIRSDVTTERFTTHGMSKLPEYGIFHGMHARCSNPAVKHYKYYGGRGIVVCERWHNLHYFLADMGPRPSSEHSIDRIDVDGNYDPSNCRWATASTQRHNQRPRER